MIIPYLRDRINDHKTPTKLKVYSQDKIIDQKTQFGEFKIQLAMQTKFIFSKNSG